MNKITILLVLISNLILSQEKLKGTILDSETKQPISDATVFISNTTVKSISNTLGHFEIPIIPSYNNIIITSRDYESSKIDIREINEFSTLKTIYLQKKAKELNTVLIKTKKPKYRYKALAIFRNQFIGKSILASKTQIINEDDIQFNEIIENGNYKLTAYSNSPIQIVNKKLGYKINYELVDFEFFHENTHENSYSQYSGYAQFIDIIEEYKLNPEVILNNRKKAYYGSSMHFIRSVFSKKINEEGFIVTEFTRKPNPKYPAQNVISQMKDNNNYTFLNQLPPKYIIKQKETPLSSDELTVIENNKTYISFTNYISILYNNKIEDSNLSGKLEKGKQKNQISELQLKESKVEILQNGNYNDTDKIIFYGQMSLERIGDMLPFDYMQ